MMQVALDRYLCDKGCTSCILLHLPKSSMVKLLICRSKEWEEEEKVWSSGVLDGDNPTSLNYMVFLVSQHMGTRGRQEYHQIMVEDLKFVRDCNGEVIYIEWIEGPTKTRQGSLKKRPRSVTQKLFKISGPKCPVSALLELLSKHPEGMKSSSPLYLAPLKKDHGVI